MINLLGMHGTNDADVIDDRTNVGKEIADGQPARAVTAEGPRRSHQMARCRELSRRIEGQRFAGALIQDGLGVECVNVRDAAVHEQEDDARRATSVVRRPGSCQVSAGSTLVLTSQRLLVQQGHQGHVAKATRGPPQQLPPRYVSRAICVELSHGEALLLDVDELIQAQQGVAQGAPPHELLSRHSQVVAG